MFFLNLTAPEFFILLSTLGALVATLYLLDRAKRKKIVSALRFWPVVAGLDDQRRRRRLRDPWSLALQLIALLLLLLAVAELQWGRRGRPARDHVLIVDSSTWTGQRSGQGTLLDRERTSALAWVRSLPSNDRIMVVRADSRPVPMAAYTSDRKAIRSALMRLSPGDSALNLSDALRFAEHAEDAPGVTPGSVVYVGPSMLAGDSSHLPKLRDLQVIPVDADLNNVGIRSLSVRKGNDPQLWEATVDLGNYGPATATRTLVLRFGKSTFSPRRVVLTPGGDKSVDFAFRTNFAGLLTAELSPRDALETDDHAEVWLPKPAELQVAVYTGRAGLISSLFPADGRVNVSFQDPSQYSPHSRYDVVIFDQFAPSQAPLVPSLWIEPPAAHSPSPVKAVLSDVSVTGWNGNGSARIRLQSRDFRIASTEAFQAFPGDITVAQVGSNPVVIARPGTGERPRIAELGFDPLAQDSRYQITTPLLFADLLSWLVPDLFRPIKVSADHVGLFARELDSDDSTLVPQVTDDLGHPFPFTLHKGKLQIFSSRPEILHISDATEQQYVSLTLPEVASIKWAPEQSSATSVRLRSPMPPRSHDLWKLLALLAGVILLVEWVLYSRSGARKTFNAKRKREPASADRDVQQLVLK